MVDYRTYPRITGSLRVHSNIAEPLHYRGDIDELQHRRQRSSKIDSTETISWNQLQSLISQHSTTAETGSQMGQLRKYAIEFGLFDH